MLFTRGKRTDLAPKARILELPYELVIEILEWLSRKDLGLLRRTSKLFKDLTDPIFFHKWNFTLDVPCVYRYCSHHELWYSIYDSRGGIKGKCPRYWIIPAILSSYFRKDPNAYSSSPPRLLANPFFKALDSTALLCLPIISDLTLRVQPVNPYSPDAGLRPLGFEIAKFYKIALPLILKQMKSLKNVRVYMAAHPHIYQGLFGLLTALCHLCGSEGLGVNIHVTLMGVRDYYAPLHHCLTGLRDLASLEVEIWEKMWMKQTLRNNLMQEISAVVRRSPKLRMPDDVEALFRLRSSKTMIGVVGREKRKGY